MKYAPYYLSFAFIWGGLDVAVRADSDAVSVCGLLVAGLAAAVLLGWETLTQEVDCE